jgi:hypothetical protein
MAEMSLPLRKRVRSTLSCVECRRRKIKCDRKDPCDHCKKSRGVICVYSGSGPSQKGETTSALLPRVLQQSQSVLHSSSNPSNTAFSSESFSSPTATTATVDSNDTERGKDLTSLAQENLDATSEDNLAVFLDEKKRIEHVLAEGGSSKVNGNGDEDVMRLKFSASTNMIIENGDVKGVLRTKTSNPGRRPSVYESRESASKIMFFGQSNWKHSRREVNSSSLSLST